MCENARSHRSSEVLAYLQSEAVTSLPWPAMSSDLNLIEHVWDMIGSRVQAVESPVQNLRQLKAAFHRESDSYNNSTPDDWPEGWHVGVRPSSKHVVVLVDTVLWTMSLSGSKFTFCKCDDNAGVLKLFLRLHAVNKYVMQINE